MVDKLQSCQAESAVYALVVTEIRKEGEHPRATECLGGQVKEIQRLASPKGIRQNLLVQVGSLNAWLDAILLG